MSIPRKVLLVGWDSADWKVINPLLDAGKLPHLEQLINGGVIGNLATLYPVLSPMLWTSIATGKRPMKHGIHGFAEPDPHSGGVRPITNLSRKTKAVWNILAQNGRKCIVVGWWPSHPAEPLPDGVMVSNHYQRAPHPGPKQPWPMPPGTVHPARLAEPLAELRLHPAELDGSHILPFVPKAAEIDQKQDRRLEGLVKTIADCTSIHAAATHLIQSEPWDFMAVYFDAIDHFGHGFMRYHPPRQKWISERDFELYSGVIEAGYRYHDMMLGVLMAMTGPETTVLLMSDHGFHPDHLRPRTIPVEPAGPAVEHRHYGIFALKGPGVKKDDRIYGATVLDICPTLLTLFGLPVGQDMDGKPLVTAFDKYGLAKPAQPVAQVSQPAVSPISKSAEHGCAEHAAMADTLPVGTPATQQTSKSAARRVPPVTQPVEAPISKSVLTGQPEAGLETCDTADSEVCATLETVPTWDDVPGADGSHPPGTKLDAGEAREALKQLEALGYIQPLPEDAEKAVAETARELQYNLACAHTDAGQHAAAADIFAELWRDCPDEHRYGAKLITSQLALGRFTDARTSIEQLRANRKKYAVEARAELKKLREKLKRKESADQCGGDAPSPNVAATPSLREKQTPPEPAPAQNAVAQVSKPACPVEYSAGSLQPAKLCRHSTGQVSPISKSAGVEDKRRDAGLESRDPAVWEICATPNGHQSGEKASPATKATEASPPPLTPQEQMELRRLSARASLSPVPMLQLEAMLLLAENKPAEELAILKKLEKGGRARPDFCVQLGRCSLGVKKNELAERYFQKALELDPEHAYAHQGLAQLRLAQRRNFEAAGSALTSVGLLYHNPVAHFQLGVALHRLGKVGRAVEALRVCVGQSPNFVPAHRRLAMIYQNRLKRPQKAAEHRERIRAIVEQKRIHTKEAKGTKDSSSASLPSRPSVYSETASLRVRSSATFDPASLSPARADAPFVIIVSGLPRSGTSLMMQMLAAGGLAPLHDGHRPADTDNPRGYFEFAPAKNIRADTSWLAHAEGRSLKLIAQLLPFLPPNREYRIVLMERSLDEVLASQSAMLEHQGRNGAALAPGKLRAVFEQQLARVSEILERRNLPVLRVRHADCLRDPAAVAGRLKTFLALPLDLTAMASVVDTSLYRQRKASTAH